MKCKYPDCTNAVPEPRGKRQYCSNAHKQADYRRRKTATDSGTTTSTLELSQALTRISMLEQRVLTLEEYVKVLSHRLQDAGNES